MSGSDNKLRGLYPLLLPIVALGTSVGFDVVFGHGAFSRHFDGNAVHTLVEVMVVVLSATLAGFFLTRLEGRGDALHFWMSCSLLVMGTYSGLHALAPDSGWSLQVEEAGIVAGLLLALLAVLPDRRTLRLRKAWTPVVLVAAATSSGIAVMTGAYRVTLSADVADLVHGLSGLFFVGVGVQMLRLHRRHPHIDLPWLAAYVFSMGAGLLPFLFGMDDDGWWFWHVARAVSLLALNFFVLDRLSEDSRRLELTTHNLKLSEARFRAITENTSDVVFIVGTKGSYTYVSPAAAALVGLSEQELIGRLPGGFTHDDDKATVLNGIRRATNHAGETIRVGTIRVRHADGHWLYLEGLFTAMFDDPGVEGVVLNYRDITERVTTEQAMRHSQRQLTTLIGNLPGMVYRCRGDQDISIVYVNEGCRSLTGYAREDLIEGTVTAPRIVHPQDFPRLRTTIWKALDSRESFQIEYRMITKDGRVKWVLERGVGVYDDQGRLETVEGFVLDVSERVQAENELRRSKYSIDHASDAVYWIGQDGSLVDVNETACNILGYSRAELLGMSIHDVSVDLVSEEWPLIWKHVKKRGSVLVEGVHRTKTGRAFPVEVSSSYQEFGGRSYHCAFARDITDRKEAELRIQMMNQELEQRVEERTVALQEAQARLVTSEKMAALGNLVAGVSHEINTPLGIGVTAASHLDSVVGRCEGLYQDGSLSKSEFETFLANIRESSSMILANLNRAAGLVQSFKSIAVDQSGEHRRRFRLGAYLDEVLVSLRPELSHKRVKVEMKCAEDLMLDGYPGAVSQIMTNLVMNALIHGFEGVDGGRLRIEAESIGGRVRLLFTDNGCGMNEEQVHRIFEPFYTTKRGRGGSGLGMNIVFNLVTQMLGGSIVCRSEPDGGTTFEIDLPLAAPGSEPAPVVGEPTVLV